MATSILLDYWATAMWRACWQGSIVLLVVWIICRLLPSMPARYQCWCWRLAILKFGIVLLLPTLVNLPLLPAPAIAGHANQQPVVGMPVATDLPSRSMDHVAVVPHQAVQLPSMRAILGFGWIVGVCWCLTRLSAAWYRARRLRRQSQVIKCSSLLDQLAIQGRLFRLRCLPKLVEVGGSGSPMLIGVFRPTIVIPTETLGRLTRCEQAMVLGHECAHIRRGDLFSGLIASIVRAVFFFHPLVWWGERQLTLAQEVAADELVIARQRHEASGYGSLLVSVVSKLGPRPLVSIISVETAGTVRSLAKRLVAMTRIRPTSPRIIASSGILLGAVLLLGIVPWRLVAAEPKDGEKQPLLTVTHKEHPVVTGGGTPPADTPPVEASMHIGGTCVDEKGKPVAGAHAVLFRLEYRSFTQQQLLSQQSDDQGKFHFPAVPRIDTRDVGRERYVLLVQADGKATTLLQFPAPDVATENVKVELTEPARLSGTVVDLKGKPVAGAMVSAYATFPVPVLLLEPVLGFLATKTDAQGRFEIVDLPPVDGSQHEVGTRHFRLTMKNQLAVSVECPGFEKTRTSFDTVPQDIKITLAPAAIIEGRVIYGETGKPAAGITVQTQTSSKSKSSAFAQTVTDAEGHYRLESLSTGEYNIWAKADDWTVQAIDSLDAVAGQARIAPDLQLVRGGLIVGRVIDEESGLPVDPEHDPRLAKQFHQADVAFSGPARPRSGAACESVPIQSDGSFRLRTAPGSTFVYVRMGPVGEWSERCVPNQDGMVAVDDGQTVEIEFRVRKEASP